MHDLRTTIFMVRLWT